VRVLVTAFEPYDHWTENSSWLTLVELLQDRPLDPELVTRRYPVDLAAMQERLYQDLQQGFDAVIHLGQSPGSPQIKLEAIALNVAGRVENSGDELTTIEVHGPVAYRSRLPLGHWASLLRERGTPVAVSYHAGTYLCNATMYASMHILSRMTDDPLVGFIHLPLAPSQAAKSSPAMASMDLRTMASAIRALLVDLAESRRSSASSKSLTRELA
jgi:pyroglutamyl-peptidase